MNQTQEDALIKGKVLVVDDNERNRKVCRLNLAMEGIDIIEAKNGQEGLEKTLAEQPDVILLDIMMPIMDGYEMLQKVRSSPTISNTMIIMLTAKVDVEDVIKALEYGANDFLRKPFDVREMVARVKTFIRLKHAEDKLTNSISLLEHQATLGNLLSGAAHDLNNILSEIMVFWMIKGHAKTIQKALTEEQKPLLEKYFNHIENACTTIHEAVEMGQTLCQSFTRFAKGSSEGKKKQSIVPLISAPIGIIKRKLKKRKISLQLDIERNLPYIYCNSGEIQRLALNLYINAIQAMEGTKSNDKEHILSIKTHKQDAYVKFQVKDTGCGIDPTIQHRIFEEHFTTKEKGSGIGLATVKKIVDLHEATIDCITEQGKGTQFDVLFPSG